MALRPLTPTEARVLGTLMEKARTVPDSYPLTLNSLLAGCNQKTSREPPMNVSEGQVQEALEALKQLAPSTSSGQAPSTSSGQGLVLQTSGSRVARWEHNFQRALGVPEQAAVLLGLLMLRGPQTAGELRINSERWYRFADISSVEGFLEELRGRPDERGGPLVVRLARSPGMREQRWAHLLCGPVAVDEARADQPSAAADTGFHARITALEGEVAALRSAVQNLYEQLGMSQPGQADRRGSADNE